MLVPRLFPIVLFSVRTGSLVGSVKTEGDLLPPAGAGAPAHKLQGPPAGDEAPVTPLL